MKKTILIPSLAIFIGLHSCKEQPKETTIEPEVEVVTSSKPQIQHTLTTEQTHNKFSNSIPPVLTVKSGAVIEAFTKEASDGQFNLNSTIEALDALDFEPIHPLTGPVYVEDAQPGDVLKVTLHTIELGDWGWNAILPGFGFLVDDINVKYLKLYELEKDKTEVTFKNDIKLQLNPFPGVMGVAPDTDELLSTIPPRANGGNMDDPNMSEGTVMYFPVFVEGGLFSIGDGHAVQGLGEVCGTAIETSLRIVYEIELLKDKSIKEPQYETDEYYATTGFAPTLDEAAKKATLYMVNYLEANHDLTTEEAYALCSLAGDLQIAEVVDLPNMLVTMHMKKSILNMK
ncbi:acetamidase/formamidase family protein [Winogradskyella immobilis]|uniref:Acetamidase/formamidase family protein n=1 Tax=Winogradskyella immobilis TaxID=2816852 RepID=A0ABS8EPW3_9FLAO|nr:acetamidase/formamidase family protein [Winogradskyella immobilis]MCC1485269.1 acetamidase/formamidase family protein [Winogradskyella immobilis]MCG0017361.1 acetamidase/formamidase family protein [Winogradskyella immobilis]